jgi:hypothetical protein
VYKQVALLLTPKLLMLLLPGAIIARASR